ncbi:hypothetical protein OG417_07855 [Actinoallomurus sp. NBC_01490]|jgi:hypothetical protein|uniref:hypothetical protein n=1 Tax=Actinoallomurus sp. NBC_01490 TaxID=2903557 RepID=UPI002E321D7A|nr:hypothetical protein [Actinoallomurus sp. NBC_01490]
MSEDVQGMPAIPEPNEMDSNTGGPQVAATIGADGGIWFNSGIASVTHNEPGRYTLHLVEGAWKRFSVPLATLEKTADWHGEIYARVYDSSAIEILTGANGEASDQPFHFVLP